MNDLTKKLFKELHDQPYSKNMVMPPPFMENLDMQFLSYEAGKGARVSFPVRAAYNNPMGVTFGGYFGIFFDAAFGPFSGITAKGPTTSMDLNICFLKSLSPKDKELIIDVEVVSHSKSYLLLHAKAYKGDNVLVATANSRMLILDLSRAGKK